MSERHVSDVRLRSATARRSLVSIWIRRSSVALVAAAVVAGVLWVAGVEFSPIKQVFQSEPEAPTPMHAPAPQVLAAPSQPAAKPPGVEAYESDTPVRLILASTSPGRNIREGSAAIGTSLENAQIFATGGLLPNGSRLIEVHPDHVVLERKRARIEIFVGNSKPPKVVGVAGLSDRMQLEEHMLAVGGPDARGEEIKPPPLDVQAAMLRSQPVFANGVLRGLQVDPGTNLAHFNASGLQPGDIVTSIDGLKVEQPEQIEDLLGALGSRVPVVVTVERQGQLEHVSIDLSRLEEPSRNAGAPAEPGPAVAALPPPPPPT